LKAKKAEIQLSKDFGWVESLDITTPPVTISNINDDVQREAAFYEAALAATKEGVARLEAEKIPFMRPNDFFAEMLKPDEHMARIKDKLLLEKKKMNVVAERRQQKEQKKYHKQVRAKKQESKAKEKKQHMEELKSMRKKRKGTDIRDGGGDLDVKSSLSTLSALPGLQKLGSADGDDDDDGEKPSGYTSKSSSNMPQKSKKRKLKDQKYGFGGKKRGLKKNDAVSAASMKDFDTRKNNDVRGFVPTEFGFGKKPKKTMKKAKTKRLGKNRRKSKK